jgi:GDPmannose 4,6-dehydratase
MWLMLQQETPDDYVICTGEAYSVRDFLDAAAACCSLDWNKYVEIDPRYFRPTEVDYLLGDSTKARTKLGWKPKVSFKELVKLMVDNDMEMARQELTLLKAGHTLASHGTPQHYPALLARTKRAR